MLAVVNSVVAVGIIVLAGIILIVTQGVKFGWWGPGKRKR